MPIVPLNQEWGPSRVLPPPFFEIEDVFYPNISCLIYGPECLFSKNLAECFPSAYLLESNLIGHSWWRDPFLRTQSGALFAVCPSFAAAKPRGVESKESYARWMPMQSHRTIHTVGLPKIFGYKIIPFLAHTSKNRRAQTSSDPYTRTPIFGLHRLPLAGGNLIVGRGWNETYRSPNLINFVGKNVPMLMMRMMSVKEITKILTEMSHSVSLSERWRAKFPEFDETPDVDTHAYPGYKAAKQFFRQFLGNTTIFLDQWTYHLDLSIAYIGGGVALVHDFNVTERFLTRQHDQYSSLDCVHMAKEHIVIALQELLHRCRLLKDQFQRIVESQVKTLTAAGVCVVRVPGVLFAGELTDGIISYAHTASVLANRLSFNILNLIAVDPHILHTEDGSAIAEVKFRLCVPGPQDFHTNEIFQNLLKFVEFLIQNTLKEKHRRVASGVTQPHIVVEWKIFAAQGTGATYAGFESGCESGSPAHTAAAEDEYYAGMPGTTATWMLESWGGLRCSVVPISQSLKIVLHNGDQFLKEHPTFHGASYIRGTFTFDLERIARDSEGYHIYIIDNFCETGISSTASRAVLTSKGRAPGSAHDTYAIKVSVADYNWSFDPQNTSCILWAPSSPGRFPEPLLFERRAIT